MIASAKGSGWPSHDWGSLAAHLHRQRRCLAPVVLVRVPVVHEHAFHRVRDLSFEPLGDSRRIVRQALPKPWHPDSAACSVTHRRTTVSAARLATDSPPEGVRWT